MVFLSYTISLNQINQSAVSVIQTLCSNLKEINPTVIKTKISRLASTKDKFRQKKKVRGFENLKDFLDADFHVRRKLETQRNPRTHRIVKLYQVLISKT